MFSNSLQKKKKKQYLTVRVSKALQTALDWPSPSETHTCVSDIAIRLLTLDLFGCVIYGTTTVDIFLGYSSTGMDHHD